MPKLLLACAALLIASCDIPGPSCTLIFCGDSIGVTLQPAVDLPYRATLSFPQGETVTFQCTSASRPDVIQEGLAFVTCSPSSIVVMCDAAPDYCSTSPVAVSVAGPEGSGLDGIVTPTYSISQPNGPRCGPTCRKGTATLP